MTEMKLSERLKNWKFPKLRTSIPICISWMVAELEAELEKAKDDYAEQYYIVEKHGMMYSSEEYKTLEAERDTLKEQNAENERWAARHKATKEEWGKQLTKSEEKVKELTKKLWESETLLTSEIKLYHGEKDRLAKAQEWLQKGLDDLEDSNYIVMMLSDFDKLKEALGGSPTEGDFKAYLRCKEPSEQCDKCEFLKQCKELNPQSELSNKGEEKN